MAIYYKDIETGATGVVGLEGKETKIFSFPDPQFDFFRRKYRIWAFGPEQPGGWVTSWTDVRTPRWRLWDAIALGHKWEAGADTRRVIVTAENNPVTFKRFRLSVWEIE